MASYTLTVKNKSGGTQNYGFFNAAPTVSGSSFGPIWPNVMKASPSVPDGAQSTLEISLSYYAICGSFVGDPQKGGKISVSKTVPVKLGSKTGQTITMGSSVGLTVMNKTSCDLGPPTNPGQGKVGNYFLDTAPSPGKEFTFQDAVRNNLLVGIAAGPDADLATAMGSFAPYPNAKYQIMPSAVFYVAAGERFEAGELVKVEMLGPNIAADFNVRGTNNITVIHNEDNTFSFA